MGRFAVWPTCCVVDVDVVKQVLAVHYSMIVENMGKGNCGDVFQWFEVAKVVRKGTVIMWLHYVLLPT